MRALIGKVRATPDEVAIYAKYIKDPVGFARDVLKIKFLTSLQCLALESLLKPPYSVLCPSANNQGKSFLGAIAVLWWFCTRSPCIIITTASSDRQVKDILWKEIRKLARRAKLKLPFLPKACRIERAPDDFAWGGTAANETSFQGHHGPNIFFLLDECTAIDPEFWTAIEGMFKPPTHARLGLFNPTDTTSRVYAEMSGTEKKDSGGRGAGPQWTVVRMSALDHPNIEAELKGEEPPVPDAMGLETFDRLFRKWSQIVGAHDVNDKQLRLATDVVWPPEWAKDFCAKTKRQPRLWRPGPIAEARLLGRFPRQGINSVYSDGDWSAAVREGYPLLPIPLPLVVPQIGCDVGRFGDDFTETHVRIGPKSVRHEAVNGQDTVMTARNLIAMADHYALWFNTELSKLPQSMKDLQPPIHGRQIPIKIDDSGVGGGVTDQVNAAGYRAVPINSSSQAIDKDAYPNRRSELWFSVAERARENELDLSGIASDDKGNPLHDQDGQAVRLILEDVVEELKRQAMAASWTMDSRGRRVVIPKDEQKQKLGRSPDGIDAVNLAYCEEASNPDALPEIVFSRRNPMASNFGRR